jgi:hypothetical protein
MTCFEIYFNDLKKNKQKDLLKFCSIKDESELSLLQCPLYIIEKEDYENEKKTTNIHNDRPKDKIAKGQK